MIKVRLSAATIAAILLGGCADMRTLTIHSNPEGAMLIERATGSRHIAPAKIRYQVRPEIVDANGCLRVHPFTAVWASGVTLNPPTGPLLLCNNYSAWTMTIQRPNAPGLEQDLAAANAWRQKEIQRLEREIMQLDAAQRALGGMFESPTSGYVPTPSYSSRTVQENKKVTNDIPVWARKRDFMDIGPVCSSGMSGTYCGFKQ
jgi:hypothetical protein